nr:hypothetical protein [uncultured Roseibium sp.]
MEVLKNPPFITSHQASGSSADAPSDQDTFQFREQPPGSAGDHDDWIPIETMSPPVHGPGQSAAEGGHTTWIPIETINQSPHKPGQSGGQEDQPGTPIFELGQDGPIIFDDYSFF